MVETTTDPGVALVRKHCSNPKPAPARRIEREFRVPMEPHMWPALRWVAACTYAPELPTDDETRMVASYIDFVLDGFYGGGSLARRARSLPLPLVTGHNAAILVKQSDGWGYRRMSWETGSWPHAYRRMEGASQEALTLVQVLDKLNNDSEKWNAWKSRHSELFS